MRWVFVERKDEWNFAFITFSNSPGQKIEEACGGKSEKTFASDDAENVTRFLSHLHLKPSPFSQPN